MARNRVVAAVALGVSVAMLAACGAGGGTADGGKSGGDVTLT
ncbi:hypothetical protein [Pengzhenrongella sp.]|jgi:hypothetical protein